MRNLIFLLFFSGVIHAQVANKLLIGDVEPKDNPRFKQIPSAFIKQQGRTYYLHKQALDSLTRMMNQAKSEGVQLKVISAFRSFNDQKWIWEAKWDGRRAVNGDLLPKEMEAKEKALLILQYSSMPGTSRHHWGTEVDLNALENSYFESTEEGKIVYDWLVRNAEHYGFFQPYTSKSSGRTGYEEEKWHWSFAPISEPYLDAFVAQIELEQIPDFKGKELIQPLEIIQNYVLGVSRCK